MIVSLYTNLSYKELVLPGVILADYQPYFSYSTEAE